MAFGWYLRCEDEDRRTVWTIRHPELAGVVAVEITGGPEIPFHPGRPDKTELPPEGRLPNATKGKMPQGAFWI
ncbi:hypothetical protein SO802_030389 [Lithocarpus litseifolius]|uniref:Uncharacterized protein n=1 Tax=Lithocarpus litseifolius TaxID=425828 RepID=A0AAW2BJ49_9ROSI